MTAEFESRVLELRDATDVVEVPKAKPEVEAMSDRVAPLVGRAGELLEGTLRREVIENGDKIVYVLNWGNNDKKQITLSVRESSVAFIGYGNDAYTRLTDAETEDVEALRAGLITALEHPVPIPSTIDIPAAQGQ